MENGVLSVSQGEGREEAGGVGGDGDARIGEWGMGNGEWGDLDGSRLVEGSKYRARLNFFARLPGSTRASLLGARKN